MITMLIKVWKLNKDAQANCKELCNPEAIIQDFRGLSHFSFLEQEELPSKYKIQIRSQRKMKLS